MRACNASGHPGAGNGNAYPQKGNGEHPEAEGVCDPLCGGGGGFRKEVRIEKTAGIRERFPIRYLIAPRPQNRSSD